MPTKVLLFPEALRTSDLYLTASHLWGQCNPKEGFSTWFQGHYPPCSSLSNSDSHAWAKKSLKTTSSLANDVVLQKVSPGWKTAQNGWVLLILPAQPVGSSCQARSNFLGMFWKADGNKGSCRTSATLHPSLWGNSFGTDLVSLRDLQKRGLLLHCPFRAENIVLLFLKQKGKG